MAERIAGKVIEVDAHGNLVTDITPDTLRDAPTDNRLTVHCDGHETFGLQDAYDSQPPMTLIALFGDSGRLELAIVDDSAKIMLGVSPGAAVEVRWAS